MTIVKVGGRRAWPLPPRRRDVVEYGLSRAGRVGMLAGKALGAGNSSSWSSTSNKITDAMKERSP